MKKKTISHIIAHEYRKTISIAVVGVILTTLLIVISVLLLDRNPDLAEPRYLVHQIDQHIEKKTDKEFSIDEEGLKLLEKYNSWVQILNSSGNVIFQENAPKDIPVSYSTMDLINYTLSSDRLEGYTLYVTGYESDLIIVVGCSSDILTKYSYTVKGTFGQIFLFCAAILAVVTVLMIVVLSKRFSKKIALPTSRVIERVQSIGVNKDLNRTTKENDLYKDVFVSINMLEHRLSENDQLRTQWISNISHDIKTPLSSIRGYAEILSSSDYKYSRDEISEYAACMLKAEQNIESLLNDLKLSQALIEGNVVLNKEKINFVELIKSCIEAASPIKKTEDQIIFDDVTNEDEMIFADEKLLKRAIVNIICNAFIHNQEAISVEIRVNWLASNVELLIKDNGNGIPKQDISHIFERYYRGLDSGKTVGTGLGLAIAKEAITANGGEISVESQEERGTVFRIMLNREA